MKNGATMNFTEYYASGEESPELEGSNSEHKVIDEGLVDVLFTTLRTNLKTNVAGPLIYFRWEWMNTKTFFTLRIKKSTFKSFMDWMKRIEADAFEEAGNSKI
jgi:hypothetical protein